MAEDGAAGVEEEVLAEEAEEASEDLAEEVLAEAVLLANGSKTLILNLYIKIISMKKYIFLLPALLILFSCGNGKDDNKNDGKDSSSAKKEMTYEEKEMQEMKEMAEKAKQQPQINPYKDAKIEVQVYNNDTVKQDAKYTGFGYAILVFGAKQVNQPHRPGMPGLAGFKTAADAKKTGEFVAYKIRNNIMPPTVSMQEMDSLGVLK